MRFVDEDYLVQHNLQPQESREEQPQDLSFGDEDEAMLSDEDYAQADQSYEPEEPEE